MTAPRPKRPPVRKPKLERITAGPLSREHIVTQMIVAPFDHAARVMDQKWGVDRLPDLVDPAKAARWGEVMADLNAAIEADDPTAARAAVETALKGLAVMDATAEASGHDPKPPAILEAEVDGFHFGIMPDDRRWPSYQDARPGLPLFSMREVGLALQAAGAANPVIAEAKKHFPRSEIVAFRPRTPTEAELDDFIPF